MSHSFQIGKRTRSPFFSVRHWPTVLISLSVFALSTGAHASALTCETFVRPGSIGHSTPLNRIERNGALQGVSGSYLVDFSKSGWEARLTAPVATRLTTKIASLFPNGFLHQYSVTEIFVVRSFDEIEALAASVSGRVYRRKSDSMIVDFDVADDFHRVYVLDRSLSESLELKELPSRSLFLPPSPTEAVLDVTPLKRRKLEPLIAGANRGGTVHVGGLISISAEPPEGFFAAATAAELEKSGWKAAPAQDADVWIYRVPDSRPESYFDFGYSSPDRPRDTPRSGKFKVATGIGPSTHPESVGGREADLLWLGDEQMGQINRYLAKISSKDLLLEDLYIERGIVQRTGDRSFVLAGIDHRYALTQSGFDAMETDPALYRRVFDQEYDDFLASLFKDSHPDPKNRSFLLATSRGCSQGCAICCSGGLSQFQYFSAPRMMTELEKLVQFAKLDAKARLNIFFVDSNFNNNPGRIIEFAQLYKASPLFGRFDFFIRHNTVNGFLKPSKGGARVANQELIDAYRDLGVKEIFMGIDSFDDASTITLKTHKFKVAKEGADSRPIYTSEETADLISALDQRGLFSKGFFLTNNPWVSDFDRIDAYYNLIALWLENPHFSIDSARDRDVIRLKPFDGSPIGDTAKLMGNSVVENGMFVARTLLGEIDEMMGFAAIGLPRVESSTDAALREFWTGISRIVAAAEVLAKSRDATRRAYGEHILEKFLDRNAALVRVLNAKAAGNPTAQNVLEGIAGLARLHSGLPAFDLAIQKQEFERNVRSLSEGLQKTNPKKGAGLE